MDRQIPNPFLAAYQSRMNSSINYPQSGLMPTLQQPMVLFSEPRKKVAQKVRRQKRKVPSRRRKPIIIRNTTKNRARRGKRSHAKLQVEQPIAQNAIAQNPTEQRLCLRSYQQAATISIDSDSSRTETPATVVSNEQPTGSNDAINVDSYNKILINDRQLNKFMENSLIRMFKGSLYMLDTEEGAARTE